MCRLCAPRTRLDDFREKPWHKLKYIPKWHDHITSRLYGISKVPTIPIFVIYDTIYGNPTPPYVTFPIAFPLFLIYNTFWTLGDIICPELWVQLY